MPRSPARCGFAAPVPSGSGISPLRSPASDPDGSSQWRSSARRTDAVSVRPCPSRWSPTIPCRRLGRRTGRCGSIRSRSSAGRCPWRRWSLRQGSGHGHQRGYLAVAFQPGQPEPAIVADLLEVLQAGVPAVEKHVLRGEATAAGHQHHLPEMVVLGLTGTEREISANIEHQESATKDLCFLVSILQVRAKVVSFSVSFPNSTLHALIAFLVLIQRRASMDG